MDNTQPSFGPGSATLGGASNVTQAIPQPGAQNVMQQQVSPASAIYQPGLQVAPQPPLPNSAPMNHFAFQGSMGTPPMSPQQQPPAPQAPQPPKAETASIIEALTKRLHDLSKLEHSIHGVQ